MPHSLSWYVLVWRSDQVSTDPTARSPLPSLFTEAVAMMACSGDVGVVQIKDYGLVEDSYFIAMETCATDLLQWRRAVRGLLPLSLFIMPFVLSERSVVGLGLCDALCLFVSQKGDLEVTERVVMMKVFRSVVAAVQGVHGRGIVHFDLKCDNVFLRRTDVQHHWEQVAVDAVVAVGDFGEALFDPLLPIESIVTLSARGTESVKSPEMRVVGGLSASGVQSLERDRRRQLGAGASSDVWSLGCLLYELLTGRVLFPDDDSSAAACSTRVTTPSLPLLTSADWAALTPVSPSASTAVACSQLGDQPGVAVAVAECPLLSLLACLLQRDPSRRPTLSAVLRLVDGILAQW